MDCARCSTPIEAGDLRCSICALATPTESGQRQHTHVEVLRCDGCGAAVSYDVKVQAPRCGFCGATMHVEGIDDPMEAAQWYVSFSVDPDKARKAVRRWLGDQGFFTPDDLVAEATIEQLRPLWWVGWVFEADALVSWAADSNMGTRKAKWAPFAGQTQMRFEDLLVSASRGLTDVETRALVGAYQLAQGAPEPAGAENPVIERFDVQRSAARAAVMNQIERVAMSRVAKQQIPGTRNRNLAVVSLLEGLKTRRVAFPAYVLAYRYREDLFRVVVHGQDELVIVGKAPKSLIKQVLVAGGVILGAAVLLALLSFLVS